MLQHQIQQGNIRGLILARQAPSLTNLMYADGLLLMGSANRQEAQLINKVLQTFCNLSGQRISPEKSKLWFSRATTLAQVRSIMWIFGAKFADENETYLGGPVNVSWPAGKLALIKSVLESHPMYHMSSTPIHKSVLDKIQSKCVQFFWGKTETRLICLVRWDKLTRPKSDGGLGLRNLSTMNNALILKCAWNIVSGNEAIWVHKLCVRNTSWHHPFGSLKGMPHAQGYGEWWYNLVQC